MGKPLLVNKCNKYLNLLSSLYDREKQNVYAASRGRQSNSIPVHFSVVPVPGFT